MAVETVAGDDVNAQPAPAPVADLGPSTPPPLPSQVEAAKPVASPAPPKISDDGQKPDVQAQYAAAHAAQPVLSKPFNQPLPPPDPTKMAPGEKDLYDLKQAGASQDVIDQYQAQTTAELRAANTPDQVLRDYWGIKDPDTTAMKDHIAGNLAIYHAANADKPTVNANGQPKNEQEAHTFKEALTAGLQMSVAGMYLHGKMPDMTLPENADFAHKMVAMAGQWAPDLPIMLGAGVVGAGLGEAAAGPPGAVLGGGAAAWAAPETVRKMLIDHYQRGDIKDASEFAQRLMATAWTAVKSGTTGAATAAAGAIAGPAAGLVPEVMAPVAGKLASFAAEVATMTSVGRALEGHLPSMQDFEDTAVLTAGFHGVGMGVAKLHGIFANTGEKPDVIAKAAAEDPQLNQELKSSNPDLPIQARPTDAQGKPLKPLTVDDVLPKPDEKAPVELKAGTASEGGSIPEEPAKPTTALERVQAKIVPDLSPDKPNIVEQAKALPGLLMRQIFDDRKSLKDIAVKADEQMKAQGQEGLEPSANPYDLSMLHRQRVEGITLNALTSHTTDFATGKPNGEGYSNILSDVKAEDGAEFSAFVATQHALEVHETGKDTIFTKDPQDLADAREVVANGQEKFGAISQRLTDWRNRMLKYYADSGLMSQKGYQAAVDLYQHYVSVQHEMDENPLPGDEGQFSIKRLKGSGDRTRMQDPIMTMAQDAPRMIQRAEYNRTVRAIVDLPNVSDFAEKKQGILRPVQIGGDEIAANLRKQGIDLGEAGVSGSDIGDMKAYRTDLAKVGKYDRVVYRDGKPEVWRLDKDVADAMRPIEGNPEMTNLFLKYFLKKPADMLRAGVIYTGAFAGRHLVRNETAVALHSDTVDSFTRAPLESIMDSIGDMMGKSDEFKAARNAGLDQGAREELAKVLGQDPYGLDKETGFVNARWNVIKNAAEGKALAERLTSGLGKLGYYAAHPIEAGASAIRSADMAARISEFKRQGGADPEATLNDQIRAARAAQEVTLNNQRAGATIRALNQVTPFFNIAVQSPYKMYTEITENPARYAMRAAAQITLPSLLTWMHGHGDSRYDEAPNWEKILYYIIPTDRWEPAQGPQDLASRAPDLKRQKPDGTWEVNNGETLRYPRAFLPGAVFGALPEMMLSEFAGHNPNAMKDLGEHLFGQVAPAVNAPLAMAVVEHISNHNFFQSRPLVSAQMEKELPQNQFTPYTSTTAKLLGKAIQFVGAPLGIGNGRGEGLSIASPIVIDNYIADLTGTLGKYAVGLVDAGLHAVGVDNKVRPEKVWADNPFVKEFTLRNPGMNAQSVEDFRQNYFDAEKHIKRGDYSTAQALRESSPDLKMKLGQAYKAVTMGASVIRGIYEDSSHGYTATDKRQLIETEAQKVIAISQAMNAQIADFKKKVNDSKKAGGQ